MRIALLLPSATEVVFALGLGDQLVAVTHECDFPAGARDKTPVTKSLLPEGLASAQIDDAVLEGTVGGASVYELDVERLVALKPDLIITQDLCRVCAVPRSSVDEVATRLDGSARVLSLDPSTLDDVMTNIENVASAAGCGGAAQNLVRSLRQRVGPVCRRVDGRLSPRVACLEWFDPLFCAGHWVPEQVRVAGGDEVLGREGLPSAVIEWAAVVAAEPDVLVLMPCGYNAAEAAERLGELTCRPGWDKLPAVASGRVYAVDGSAYFSRPGPRLIDGIELLVRILHPEATPVPGGTLPQGAAQASNLPL